MPDDCKQKAAEIGFDLTKQFLSLALAGIAFIVGLSYSTPGAVPSLLLWTTIGVFAASAFLGFLFLARGVNVLSINNTYDIWERSLRLLAAAQIVLVMIGVVFLIPILLQKPERAEDKSGSVEVRMGADRRVSYPIEPGKSITVEIEGDRVRVSADEPQ